MSLPSMNAKQSLSPASMRNTAMPSLRGALPGTAERPQRARGHSIQKASLSTTQMISKAIFLSEDVPVMDWGALVGTRSKGDVSSMVVETINAKDTVKEFENRYNHREDSNPLPVKRFHYWTEYRLPASRRIGNLNPGPERLVVGQGGELYYTGDHYGSFTELQYWARYRRTTPNGFSETYGHQVRASIDTLNLFFT